MKSMISIVYLLNSASNSFSSQVKTTINTLNSSLAFLNASSYPPMKHKSLNNPSVPSTAFAPLLLKPDDEPISTPVVETSGVEEEELRDSTHFEEAA